MRSIEVAKGRRSAMKVYNTCQIESGHMLLLDSICTNFPGLVVLQHYKTMHNLYINDYGCDFMKLRRETFIEMGEKYYQDHFCLDELEILKAQIKNLVRKNPPDKSISFFHRIRPCDSDEYYWFFTTSQLYYFPKNAQKFLLHISLPVNECSYLGKKLESVVDENLFFRQNRENYESLTDREKEIIALISEGLTSQKISEKLSISLHTVNNHRKNIIQKVGKQDLFSFLKMNSIFSSNTF